MNYSTIKRVLSGKQAGTFSSMVWERRLPTRKAYENQVVVKRSSGIVRFGIEYDNMKSVQEKRENGALPQVNAGLKWGEWLQYPYFIKNGEKVYLRCAEAAKSKIETRYFLNGREVSREVVEPLCTKAAFPNHSSLDVFTVDIENIIAIR